MSRRLNALAGQGASAPTFPERFEPGEAAKAAVAGGDLFVILDSLPEQPVGPVKGWRKRSTAVARGDRCLLVRVGDGDYWFITWDIPGWS
jgi:hypothetical protein